MQRNNQLLLLRAQLREEKILDFLMSKAKVTEAPDPDTIHREWEAEGFHARVVQHECDHLDGILYPQRMTDLSLLMFREEKSPSMFGVAMCFQIRFAAIGLMFLSNTMLQSLPR